MATENLNTILNKIAEKGDLRQEGGAIAVNEFENFSSEDEEYLPNMPYHLAQAGWDDDLHKVLRDETEEGSNNWWYQFRESKGQTADYLTDVNYAWELANDVAFDRYPSLTIALQCRYALITSSVKSLGENIPAKLVAALVEKQVWNPAQALAYIQHDTRQVQEENKLTEVLKEIAPYLDQSMFPDALEVVQKIVDERYRAKILQEIASKLPESLLQDALAAVQEIQDKGSRLEALSAIVPRLPPPILFPQALEVTRKNQDEDKQAETLKKIASYLPSSKPLETVQTLQEKGEQSESLNDPFLKALMSKNYKIPNEDYLAKLKDASRMMGDMRAFYLEAISPGLPASLFPEALKLVQEIQSERTRAKAISGIAPNLPESLLPQALKVVLGIQDNYFRAYALSGLIPQLTPSFVNFKLWKEMLHILAVRNRKDLLADISALSSIIIALGGLKALEETMQAIKDVGQWWP